MARVGVASSKDLLRRRPIFERIIAGLLFVCAGVSVLTTPGIVIVLVGQTASFFREVSPRQFFGDTQ